MARIVYQYRLTDSVVEKEMQIAGVNLSKDWVSSPNIIEKLIPFIKTDANKTGLVDYEKKNYESNEVLYRSVPNIEDMPVYTKSQLFIMNRSELCDICRDYAMVTTNKSNEFLVKEILEKQAKFVVIKEEIKETPKEEIKQVVIEKPLIVENDSIVNNEAPKRSMFDILKR